jgi:hypothetical protein
MAEELKEPEEPTQNSQSKPKKDCVSALTAIAATLTAIAAVLTSIGAPDFFPDIAKRIGLGSLTPKDEEQPKTKPAIWYGLYRDFKEDPNNSGKFIPYLATEEIELTFSENKVTGKSKATGIDNQEQRWEQSGYKQHDFLVFAYQRVNEENEDVPGIGTYFLKRYGNDGKTYVGYWEGLNCEMNKIVHCPYVLSTANASSIQDDFNSYLQKQCQTKNLTDNLDKCPKNT